MLIRKNKIQAVLVIWSMPITRVLLDIDQFVKNFQRVLES